MNVSLWSSNNLLSAEGREPLHIRAIKRADDHPPLRERKDDAQAFWLSAASDCLGTSTVGLLSMRVTSSWSIR